MINKMYKRTTVWLPIDIHTQAKITALLTDTTFSNLVRIALIEKINRLKEQKVNPEN
jgi:hypothetical protein